MRRVRTVHLSAPTDGLLRRGELLLEDALHTAALPAADGGWLWLQGEALVSWKGRFR